MHCYQWCINYQLSNIIKHQLYFNHSWNINHMTFMHQALLHASFPNQPAVAIGSWSAGAAPQTSRNFWLTKSLFAGLLLHASQRLKAWDEGLVAKGESRWFMDFVEGNIVAWCCCGWETHFMSYMSSFHGGSYRDNHEPLMFTMVSFIT